VTTQNSREKGRPVGCPALPDLSAMSEREIEQRRVTVSRLRELTEKAENGDKKAVSEIREILEQSPDLAWRFTDVGKVVERRLLEKITREENLASKEMIGFLTRVDERGSCR
jgi:hypothetical protein